MKIIQVSISDLIPYHRNARTHSKSQVEQIANSIQEFGFTNPVLIDGHNGVIAGHGRLQAAGILGMDSVPCIQLTDMTDLQKRAYIIADNKLALNAGWDDELLKMELTELHELDFDLELIGFSPTDLTLAMGLGVDFAPGLESDQGRLDQLSPIKCPACGHEFHK